MHPSQVLAPLLVLHSLCSFSVAQNFTISQNWRKPTSTLGRSDRASLLNGLTQPLPGMFNQTTALFKGLTLPQTASMLSAVAIGDRINNMTLKSSTGSSSTLPSRKGLVISGLSTMFELMPNIIGSELVGDAAMRGLAAIYAYEAYGDPTSLQQAQSMWTQLSGFLVTGQDAASGTHISRGQGVTFQQVCQNATTAGAVFAVSGDPNSLLVGAQSTAAFMTLSAHLYEQTNQPQYLSNATLSADFIINHLYSSDSGIILDSIDLKDCQRSSFGTTADSGLTIDGLSVLAQPNTTAALEAIGGGHENYAPFLSGLISTAVVFPQWTNTTDGVIIESSDGMQAAQLNLKSGGGVSTFKGIFIRGLYQAYTRLTLDSTTNTNSPEADFIRSFVTVQLNALLDLASKPPNNQFSRHWEGPPPPSPLPPSQIDFRGQLAAIDVLTSALGFTGPANTVIGGMSGSGGNGVSSSASIVFPAPSSTSSLAALAENHKKISDGAIAGIVIAVVFIVSLAGAFAFMVLRRRRIRRRRAMERMAQAYDFVPSPQGPGDRNPTLEDARGPESRKERFAQQIRYFGSVRRTHDRRTRPSPRIPRTSPAARDEKKKEAAKINSGKEKVGYTIEKKQIVDEEEEVTSLSKVVEDLRRAALPSDYGSN